MILQDLNELEGKFQTTDNRAFTEAWTGRIPIKPSEFLIALAKDLPASGSIVKAKFEESKLSYSFYAKKGSVLVLEADRQIDTKASAVVHGGAEVLDIYQDKDWNKVFARNSILLYRRLGLKRVNIEPGLTMGGYAQARLGFVPADAAAWADLVPQVRARLEAVRHKLDAQTIEDVEELLSGGPENITDLAQADAQVDNEKLGKYLLRRTTWVGMMDLMSDDSFDTFWGYVKDAEVKP